MVQDTDSMKRVFLAIKGDPSPALSRVLSSLSTLEDQALKVKRLRKFCPIVKPCWPGGTPTGKRLTRWRS